MAAIEVGLFTMSLMWSLGNHVTSVSGQSTVSTGQGGAYVVDVLEEILETVKELRLRQSVQEHEEECHYGCTPGDDATTATPINSVDDLQTEVPPTSVSDGCQHKQEQIEELLAKQDQLLKALNASLERQQQLRDVVDQLGMKLDARLSRTSSSVEVTTQIANVAGRWCIV